MAKVVLDPVTRIEGHLSIELEGDFNFDTPTGGTVTGVQASGTMYRGFENILKGRDPRDAIQITQRI